MTTTTETTSKKAFDLSRNSIYVASPDELCLIGGKAELPEDQQGPLDTAHREGEHELWDKRLRNRISPESVANIDTFGVMEPVIIAKANGVPTVVDGRGRVRRARLANALRAARGEPPITIECKVLRSSGNRLLSAMIALNEVRDADDLPTKIEKLKQLLDRGVSEEDAAVVFGVKPATIKAWLSYEDNAGDALKAAVSTGEISATAATKLATRVKDPSKQEAVLADVRATGKKSVTATRAAAGKITREKGTGDGIGLSGKREQRALLNEVASMKAKDVRDGEELFWQGVEAALALVTGQGEPDKRLGRLLKKLGWSE